jgi:hypothetical protein
LGSSAPMGAMASCKRSIDNVKKRVMRLILG